MGYNAIMVHAAISGSTNSLLHNPAIGHISPEASNGGPIALIEEDDLIEIDIPGRSLRITGIKRKAMSGEEVDRILEERRKVWKP